MLRLILQLLPAALAHVLFGAHLMFHGFGWLSFLPLAGIALLALPRRFMMHLQTLVLALYAAEWIRAGALLVMQRIAEGRSPVIGGAIMAGVALFTILSILGVRLGSAKAHFR